MKKTIYFIVLTILVAGILSVTALAIYQNQISADFGMGEFPETITGMGEGSGINEEFSITDPNFTPENTEGVEYTPPIYIDTGISGATGSTGGALPGGGGTSGGGGSSGGSSGAFSVPAITGNPIPSGYGPTDPQKFADSVITLLTRIAGALMIIVLLYGGVLYISSTGNEESIKKAQGAIKFAIIGMIVVVMSYFILQFVVQLIT